jgi:hypothetical protein
MGDGLTPGGVAMVSRTSGGTMAPRHHFFDSSSLSAVLSSIASASRRFSLAFSLAIALEPMAGNGSIKRLQPLGF